MKSLLNFLRIFMICALLLSSLEYLLFMPEDLLVFILSVVIAALVKTMPVAHEEINSRFPWIKKIHPNDATKTMNPLRVWGKFKGKRNSASGKLNRTKEVHEAARTGDAVKLMSVLKQMNADERIVVVETKSTASSLMGGNLEATPLTSAAENGHLYCVKVLLRYKADIESRARFSAGISDEINFTFSPLFVAAAIGHANVLSFLVKHGADVNSVRSNDDCTPLMVATINGLVKIVTILAKHGANMDLQDKQGNTALHYAVLHNSLKIAHILLAYGARQSYNNQHLTPLLLASNLSKIAVVEDLISKPQCTKGQRIDALELLGSSLVSNGIESVRAYCYRVFQYIKRGMEERFKDPSNPVLKQPMEPVEAYGNRKECQTLEELAQIQDDVNAILMERLIIRERILGTDNMALVGAIQDLADYHNGLGYENFNICIGLLIHAIKITQHCHQSIDLGLTYLINVLYRMILTNVPPRQKLIIDALEKTVLEYEKQPEKLKRGLEAVTLEEVKTFLKGVKDREVEHLLDSLLRLLQFLPRDDLHKDNNKSRLLTLMQTICRLNPRDESGNTLLHLAAVDRNELPLYNPPLLFKFPCAKTIQLLLNAGINVNAVNSNGNTPLHRAVTFKPRNYKTHLLTDMLKVLLDGGAHLDFANNYGKTAIDMAQTNEARRILSERKTLVLKCIAARAVKMFGIPYLGVVPKTLERYVSMH